MGKKTAAIIVAGGIGSRMGTDIPKQFINLYGKPIISYTIDTFVCCDFIQKLVVVCHNDYVDYCRELICGYDKDIIVVAGGTTRQISVYNGLECVKDFDCVLVHDAVRCLVTIDEIKALYDTLLERGSCTLAVKSKDTVKVSDCDNMVTATIPRDNLWQIQTPQAFFTNELLKAHKYALQTEFKATDDCSVIENDGGKIFLVEGRYENIKITTPSDMEIAKVFLKGR